MIQNRGRAGPRVPRSRDPPCSSLAADTPHLNQRFIARSHIYSQSPNSQHIYNSFAIQCEVCRELRRALSHATGNCVLLTDHWLHFLGNSLLFLKLILVLFIYWKTATHVTAYTSFCSYFPASIVGSSFPHDWPPK